MAIQVLEEEVISLADARKLLPGDPDRSTVMRWVAQGVHGIRLETLKVGRTRVTSKQALQRFCEAVTAAADGDIAPVVRTSRTRRRAMKASERRLAEAGI